MNVRYLSLRAFFVTAWVGFAALGRAPAVRAEDGGLPAEAVAAWARLPELLAQIRPPTFPDCDVSIVAHGAQPGGDAKCRAAVTAAIEACAAAGGGRVVVPAGVWRIDGSLRLRSGVNLHLSSGATLLFSNRPDDYLPPVLTRFEGVEVYNFSPPIYALDEHDVAITGDGVIDGQASYDDWWKWKGIGTPDVDRLNAMGEASDPVETRQFGAGKRLRVNFIQPYRCRNVLIEGVTIRRSPMWVIHPVLCENVTVRGVTVDSHGPNNDGCNPESCRNVLIEDCLFDTGDDCIAIKSGRNADGRRVGVPSENIVVRKCRMKDGHGGVTLGSEMSGGVRNVFVEDCDMDSPQLERAIRLKSNLLRGGYLENMYVRDVRVGEVADAVVHIDLRYMNETGVHPPVVRNVYVQDVRAKKTKRPLFLLGIAGHPIRNVVLVDCSFAGATKPSVIEDVAELSLHNYAQPE